MTTTQHMAIAKAVADRLTQGAVAGGRVLINRNRPLSSNTDSAVVVRLGRSVSEQPKTLGGRTSWSTLLEIECYGRDGPDDIPGTAVDGVLRSVFDVLATDSDLGYGVMDIAPLPGDTLSWDFEQSDTSVACVTARFVVKHQTTGRTLTL